MSYDKQLCEQIKFLHILNMWIDDVLLRTNLLLGNPKLSVGILSSLSDILYITGF